MFLLQDFPQGTIIDIPFDIGKSAMDYALEDEGFRACNPFEVGFPRLFCDIHCVRDAVIRGDRTILRNLEKATKISNHNMLEWSTEAARTESEYLDKKIDHSLKINTIYLEHIAKNTQPPEEDPKSPQCCRKCAATYRKLREPQEMYGDA